MTSLELALKLKQEKLAKEEYQRKAEESNKQAHENERKRLEEVINQTLKEFDGINGIKKEGCTLVKDREIIAEMYTYFQVSEAEECYSKSKQWVIHFKVKGHYSNPDTFTPERFAEAIVRWI